MPTGAERHEMDWSEVRRRSLEKRLAGAIEGEARFDAAARALYASDASIYQIEPLGVVIPRTKADLLTSVAIAMEQRVPLIPRGAGTSLSGQSVGPGLVIDTSKHLNRILETNIAEGWVRVEPGVVLTQLNRHLAPMGRQFGPDVATTDRATLGGMIGNNSAGSRSIRFGKTLDHVEELEVALTDGRTTTFGPISHAELLARKRLSGREGIIYRTVHDVTTASAEEIRARFPKVLRRVSGYNLDRMLPPRPFNLAELFVGSEGTLATLAEARLRIVPAPPARGLAVLHFAKIIDALQSLEAILATKPSAVELFDQMLLDMARKSALYRDRIDFVEGRPAAILLVEYLGDEEADVQAGLASLRKACSAPLLIVEDPARRERVWNVRKTALPLLMAIPGGRKPIAFVEDTAVAPERLPEFVTRFREILLRHGTDGSFYGHASVGCLHIRPLLDLRRDDDIVRMRQIAEEVVELVIEFEGALSGEHGDGLARSGFNRQLFGDVVYNAFGEVKRAFDPEGLMNPGKIVSAPPMTENLRRAPVAMEPDTLFSFEADGGMVEVARRCNGNALCRREGIGVMCPSFMATREEEHSPRGRANLFRALLEGRIEPDRPGSIASERLDHALDLCLGCKACKTECPSSVDIAKLKSEYLYQKGRRHGRGRRDRLMADYRAQAEFGSRFAPFSNWAMRSWPARWLLERLLKLDLRRRLPPFARQPLTSWFRKHKSLCRQAHGKVVLLADCFTNFHEPAIGRDAVSLLELAGYQVFLAPICCGRVMISHGFLEEARALVKRNVERLLPFVEEGTVILGMEPSCLFTLTDDWRDLLPGDETTMIARQARMVEAWLVQRTRWGGTELPAPRQTPMEVLLHGHCHQKAASAVEGTVEAIKTLAGVTPSVLDAGCCGMAGSFGYESGHFEISQSIAEQRLLPALRRSPAACVVAPGFSCRSQIADLGGRRAIHPVQLIRRRIEETAAEPLATVEPSP